MTMRTSVQVLLWILVGALAAGLGVGYFLHRANLDLQQYSTETKQLKKELKKTKAANDALALEANTRIDQAEQVARAAARLAEQLTEERRLIAQATLLQAPLPRTLKNWETALSVGLGVSVRIPPGSKSVTDTSTLALVRDTDIAWLSATIYNPQHEQILTIPLTSSTPVTFLANHDLLTGVRAVTQDTKMPVYVLHRLSNASTTHLIWGTVSRGVDEATFLSTLATMTFRP